MIRLNPDRFWDYSLETYARPGVAEACLDLQNRRDADVNILLLCCWLARSGYCLDDDALATLTEAVQDWRSAAIAPLRRIRHDLRNGMAELFTPDQAQDFRDLILTAELSAERMEQRLLVSAVQMICGNFRPVAAADLAASSIRTYLSRLAVASEEEEAGGGDDLAPEDDAALQKILTVFVVEDPAT